jgi:hypothetical protein
MPFPTQRPNSSSVHGVELGIGFGLVLLMASGFLAGGGRGRIVELVVLGAALASGYAIRAPRARFVAAAAGILVLLLEGVYGRLGGFGIVASLGYALAAAAAVVVSSRLRASAAPRSGVDRPAPGSLEYEVRRSVRHARPFCLVVVHPDGRGPDIGAVAERIAADVRATDVAIARDGRDLWLLLPETQRDAARVAAERLRLAAGAAGRTVSIGVASFTDDGRSAERLTEAARRALLRALELGGNRTVLHTAPDGGPPGWGLVNEKVA